MNFEFLAGNPRATIWFPPFFISAYSKTPRCKFSCFYPEVHDMAEKCYISAPLKGTLFIRLEKEIRTNISNLTSEKLKRLVTVNGLLQSRIAMTASAFQN